MDNKEQVLTDDEILDVMAEYGRPNDEAGTVTYDQSQALAAVRAVLSKLPGMPADEWLAKADELFNAALNQYWDKDTIEAMRTHLRARIQPAASEAGAVPVAEVVSSVDVDGDTYIRAEWIGKPPAVGTRLFAVLRTAPSEQNSARGITGRAIEDIAQRRTELSDQERGHLIDGARYLLNAEPIERGAWATGDDDLDQLLNAACDVMRGDSNHDMGTYLQDLTERVVARLAAPAAQPEKQAGQAVSLFREALAWGRVYGPKLSPKQWGRLRDDMAERFSNRLAAPPAPSQQAAPGAEPVGEVYRHGEGRDASGPREGIRLLPAGAHLPHGTKVYAAPAAMAKIGVTWMGSDNRRKFAGIEDTIADNGQEYTDVYVRATAAESAEPARCQYCDGTGDVHSPDGEWRGECKVCKPAATTADAQDVDFLTRVLDLLPMWTAEDWNELLERNPAILAMLRPLVNSTADAQGDDLDRITSDLAASDPEFAAMLSDAQGDERAALQTLVDLEDMRLRLRDLHERGHGTDYADYHKALPKAWDAARAALSRQPSAPASAEVSQAARDVLAERRRQVNVEGWTPAHDDGHLDGSLGIAAACYALAGLAEPRPGAFHPEHLWKFTRWHSSWFKRGDRRRNLIKAGALILAEIERLDRAALAAAKPEGGSHE